MDESNIKLVSDLSLIVMDKSTSPKLIVGIDVTNLRGGGGVTHIIELLAAAKPYAHGISKIIIWGGSQTLDKLPDRAWLKKVNPPALNRGLLARTLWQRFALSAAARAEHCGAASNMHVQHPHPQASGRRGRVLDRVRDVVEFQIKEHALAVGVYELDHTRPHGREELLPDLEVIDRGRQRVEETAGRVYVRDIKRDDNRIRHVPSLRLSDHFEADFRDALPAES